MIPKLIHRIWFGENPIPATYEDYWLAWQRQHPDYAFKTWRDSDIDEGFLTKKKIAEAQGMSRKADIASYEILAKHGGIYLDCDVMPYHYLDWQKIEGNVVVCNEAESDEFCSHAIIAAAPDNEIFQRATATLAMMPLNVQAPNVETGPFFFRRMLSFGPYAKLRKEAFYPYDFNEPFASILLKDLSGTYGIHVWKGSWITEEDKILNILDRLRWGDLSEAASLARDVNPEVKQSVQDYVDVVGKARIDCVVATGHNILSKYLKIKSTRPFEFLKCAFYLLEKEKDALIWQIGAADGVRADPLRPLAVNCDPKLMILEPNPLLFKRLKQNYAKNKNVTFIQAALAAASGKKTTVDVMSVPALLAGSDQKRPDVMLLDAGGMDREILQAILALGIRPKIIQCATQSLPDSGQDASTGQLAKDYVQVSFGNTLVAYRTDFFLAYCNDLYIKNGIPTIYEDALKSILRS